MDAEIQEAIISAILLITFVFICRKWISNVKKLEEQFEEDATGMVVKSIQFGKVEVLQDQRNGFVIIDRHDRPISKNLLRPIYF